MEVRGCHERLGSGVSEMKRIMVIVIIAACFLGINRFVDQAGADSGTRCGRRDSSSGSCVIEVRAPGSGGQPGKPGRPGKPARPGRDSIGQHRSSDQCGLYKPDGTCARYFPGLPTPPSDEPTVPADAPEPVVLAKVAVERMDLHAPEIGLWPDPLEKLPTGHNYVGWHNWMWIRDPGPATWGPITKTVSESGYAITATAAVTKVTWEMGNGDTKVCDKGMEHLPWQEEDKPSPTCGYVYHQRGDYTITATAHWVIVWNGLGQQGTIEMDLSSQVHTSVIEAFAVNIPNGRRHSVPSPSPSPNPTGTPTALAPCPTNHNKHGC